MPFFRPSPLGWTYQGNIRNEANTNYSLMKRIFESLSCLIVPCLAATLLLGCHHHHTDDHHHGEELGTAQITV
jgi:hypothetical protein